MFPFTQLQSFENPAYDRLREEGVEDVSLSSRSNSKIFLDSREDLQLRPVGREKTGFLRRSKCCCLVFCLLFIVAVICVIAVLVTLNHSESDTVYSRFGATRTTISRILQ